MLFNSYVFLFLFLPVVFLGTVALSRLASRRAALTWLAVASLAFYGWWSPVYLWLIGASIGFNFGLGTRIGALAGTPRGKALMVAGVAVNLAALGWFKYANFLLDSVNGLSDTGLRLAAITLPVGISFFTFQQIAYLVDAFRGETKEYDLVDYTLFVTFFPQLIAGPIVHHKEMLPQFTRKGDGLLRSRDLAVGLTILAMGLFKKVALADNAANYASPVFKAADSGVAVGFGDAWIAALAYSMQLYFDFSGYSDMAIGLGRIFGIRLPLNFHSPYKATSVVDFWRRWHMTLSRFLRDYLYVPLGGNRKGPVRRYGNLLATMTLGGLWHGAGWNFAFWGLLHGVFLCVNHAWAAIAARIGLDPEKAGRPRRMAACAATFLAVTVAWVFFRATTFGGAGRILSAMAGARGFGAAEYVGTVAGARLVAGLLLVVWLLPNTQQWIGRWRPAWEDGRGIRHWTREDRPALRIPWSPVAGWAVATAVMAAAAVLMMARASEFIYYQF
jgi:alginate O-acetyltransferase complex protein AlgI